MRRVNPSAGRARIAARSGTARVVRNPDRSRRRLLQAAIRLFSTRGFHGVSVDRIVTAARLNKRMAYHYLGNKEAVYRAAIAEVYRRIEGIEFDAVAAAGPPTDKLRRLLEAYFRFLDENPEFTRFLLWENVEPARRAAGPGAFLTKNPFLERFREVVREGIAAGQFRRNLHIPHLLIHFIGLCFIYHSNRYSLSQALNMDLADRRVRAQGLRQVVDLVFAGIMRTAAPPAGRAGFSRPRSTTGGGGAVSPPRRAPRRRNPQRRFGARPLR
jgi:TetR/AcrR family transcriptional regulator